MARDLGKPADPVFVSTWVITLLHHYYVGELPEVAQDGIARHWLIELAEYPDWAIDAACTWWVSRNNPKRNKKPLPGDISARAHEEMAPIRTAKLQVERYAKFGDNPPEFLKG